MPRRTGQLLLLCVALLSPSAAFADGKAFSISTLPPTMPDQRALIVWDGATETLAIDTTIEGPDAATAWVVPVPAEPELFEIDPGLFPTVQFVFQPRVIDSPPAGLNAAILFLIACMLFLAAWVRAAALPGFNRGLSLVLIVGAMGLGTLLLMPALGKPRGLASTPLANPDSPLVSRRQVGRYDVAILHGPEAGGITSWLTTEGFPIDEASRGAIDAYVADGWWFVASRLSPPSEALSGSSGSITPHPLGLRFAAPSAVYPMRLTGTQESSLRVDLFVFADQMASAPGFRARRCAEAELLPPLETGDTWRAPPLSKPRPSERVLVGHEQLRGLVHQLGTATRLSATLSPGQMGRDIWLEWSPPRPIGNSVITTARAIGRATTTWSVLLVAGSLVMLITWRRTTPAHVVSRIALVSMVALPAGAATLVWAFESGVRSHTPSVVAYRSQDGLGELGWQLQYMLEKRIEADPMWSAGLDPVSAEQACRALLSSARRELMDEPAGEWRNELLGVPMREAREPGAYRIWHDDHSVWYAYYDLAGQETASRLWKRPEGTTDGG